MIEVRNLVKRFGNFSAVNDVSFAVNSGEVLGFLGPNGAGKSTTMKMITGFLAPTAGSVKVNGHDVVAEPIAAKKAIGYLAEGAPAYPDMTPTAFLKFVGRVRGFSGAELERRVAGAIEKAHLQTVAHKNVDQLSKGFKRRVGIAQAILHDPPVLIMDEPTDGLDPNQKHEMRVLISDMARNKAIIVSTHILEEVNALCTRAIIIAQGKLLFDGTPAQLEQRSKYHNAITLTGKLPSVDVAAGALRALPGVAAVDVGEGEAGSARLTILPVDGAAIINEVSQLVRDKGWVFDELRVEAGRLDEVFRSITAPAGAGAQEVLT
jgi:ABC-2 type transport system ATP-binding protein